MPIITELEKHDFCESLIKGKMSSMDLVKVEELAKIECVEKVFNSTANKVS